MDFDEYDYLERMVDNSQTKKIPDAENEGRESDKSGEKERTRGSKSKSNDDEYDGDMHSKHEHQGNGLSREKSSSRRRSRSRDAVRDRHKSSAEHRERERDGVRHRNREDKNGRDRDRDRGRDRGRDREREHDGDRQRDSDRRVNDRDGERVRDREASHRGRSSSGMLQDREEGEKSRGRDIKERDGEFKERNKEIRKKKEDKVEPEADPERDQRTVFAYQISLKADERDVYEFFSRAGKVRDVRLIMDRITRRSKGVGYVEFYDAMSVPMAIALSGQPLLGLPVMVKPSEAEKNLVQPTASTAAGSGGITNPYSGGARRLYVGNLNVNITEDQLRQVFESFGAVELVQLPLDMTGQCKGFGFVQFSRLEDAKNALTLNGSLEIAGRLIKVSTVTDQAGNQDAVTNTGDLDDEEGGGWSLNARSRAILMQKLDRSGTALSITDALSTSVGNSTGISALSAANVGAPSLVSPIPGLAGSQGMGLQLPNPAVPSIEPIGNPSDCLLLKNMFDPNLETDTDFELDIKEDVQEECSKFGNLKHISVDKNSAGFVYLRFENIQSAVDAQRALHGRWFAGKMITATFMVPEAYMSKFPESR